MVGPTLNRIGRYRLGEELGAGANGVVRRATQDDGTEVAVKLLRAADAVESAAGRRFLREAMIAAAIESPHVVRILDSGQEGGYAYIVLPLYRDGSLAARLTREGRLTLDETAGLAAKIGKGLDALHERGIVHRDVKPSNVLLDGELAALADFGLARGIDSTRLTGDGQLLGTAYYLAPEVIEGEDASRASDVYALGCVLYECLVGEPPFTGRSAAELAFGHLVEPPPDPRERRPELPADAGLVLLTALAKNPSERPTSGTALARMLHLARTPRPS